MILKGYYITGPAALQSFFRLSKDEPRNAFQLFWMQKDRFKQDLSPAKCFYWDETLVAAYSKLCILLDHYNRNHCFSEEEIESLITALRCYLDYEIPYSVVSDILLPNTTDVEHMVIYASGQEFFPNNMDIQTKKTCLHKIEVNEKCEVRLANRSISVPAGECVYVVASGGKYVLLLRRELDCKFFHLKLINKPGKFASDLLVSFKNMGQNDIRYSDVISFSIINGRDLIIIHSDGTIKGEGAPTLSALGFNAIYTDSDFNNYNGFILYELSSTSDRNVCFIKPTSGGITNVCYAGYNNMGELIKQC